MVGVFAWGVRVPLTRRLVLGCYPKVVLFQ